MRSVKKVNYIEIIISIIYFLLSLSLIIFDDKMLSNYNYILVILFALIGVIKLINKKNINDIIIALVSIWSALFIYIYYYQTIMILFLPICLSIYALMFGLISLKEKNKLNFILSIIISIILIIKPFLDIIIYIKIFGVYLLVMNIYRFLKNK